MSDKTELVVLVDEQNTVLGTMPKDEVHTTNTPLHRGFSVFLFNSKGELLVTKRARIKQTFPGVWSNTVCGHPRPGETAIDAAKRRLKDELSIDLNAPASGSGLRDPQGLTPMREVSPYRYRFADANGIVENEICPILIGYTDTDPVPNPHEAEAWKWMRWEEFLRDTKKNAGQYSPWSIEEAELLDSLHLLDR